MKFILGNKEREVTEKACGYETPCWLWTGPTNLRGYGRMYFRDTNVTAHRLSFMESTGQDVPKGRLVLHRCDMPACVRPDHLFLGSYKNNWDDCVSKGRAGWQQRTECRNGHPFTPENTRLSVNGRNRHCRICQRASYFLMEARRKAKKNGTLPEPTGKPTFSRAEGLGARPNATGARIFVKDEAGHEFYFDSHCLIVDLKVPIEALADSRHERGK